MTNLTVMELENLFKLIIEKLKKDKVEFILINFDEYWNIASDEWDNFDKTPEPIVGSILEDIQYLKRTLNKNEIFTYSDFDRVGTVLKAISEKEAPTNS